MLLLMLLLLLLLVLLLLLLITTTYTNTTTGQYAGQRTARGTATDHVCTDNVARSVPGRHARIAGNQLTWDRTGTAATVQDGGQIEGPDRCTTNAQSTVAAATTDAATTTTTT
uniref:Putative secreted protein n=1 Tax=Anopheles darlingi TaxID=43151 RepID=A0A2M4D4Q9_ANODA